MVSITVRRNGDAGGFLDRLEQRLAGPDRVKVGFPAGQASSDIVARAVYNEFGTSRGIPERPFIRNAMRENRDNYRGLAGDAARAIIDGRVTKRQALERIGLKAVGDIQRGMPGTPPPNDPATIARKGSSTTLVDSGQTRQSVTHKVDG